IVVVVADADTCLPSRARQSRFCSDIGEGTVVIVFKEVCSGRGSRWPLSIESITVGEINIQPTIIVIVEEREPAALGLNDVAFAIRRTPHVGNVESCLMCDIYEHNGGRRGF